ncbi:MAG: DUF3570 domain-containing protein [Gammaproteobacteria bacterium]|nr:MAG: DUF3570 domain-containing protein [Gammaproteobacteria bacterium]
MYKIYLLIILLCIFGIQNVWAEVLPEERADIGYHYYDGGGVEVDGATMLVRKNFAGKYSIYGGYHHDSISGASPDVLAGASKYEEDRDEYTLGGTYLRDNTLMDLSYTYSDEDDYESNMASFDVSHEAFGALTKVNIGVSIGSDDIERTDLPSFEEDLDRYSFRAGLSQVITKTFTMAFDYEATVEEGFLNNPYRFVFVNSVSLGSGSEEYPDTRTGQAYSLKGIKYWQHRASTSLGYRFYRDTWDVRSSTVDLNYSQYIGNQWVVDVYGRYYTQDKADFYSDNFSTRLRYMARDKELSSFDSFALGGRIRYDLFKDYKFLRAASLNLAVEYLDYDYDDYSGIESVADVGSLGSGYTFDATTIQFYFSAWY